MPRHARQVCIVVALVVLAMDVCRAEPPPNVAKPAQPAVAAELTECDRRLSEFAAFTRLPAIGGPGECGGEDLVKLEAVQMPDRSRVLLTPPATLRCTMAEGVAQFVRGELAPAAAELGAPLSSVVTAASYDCRNRNRQQAARISEHARANALDIGALKLADRTTVSLTDPMAPQAFREQMRDAACRWFSTVLGPGSDGYHDQHVHLDRAERDRGYRLCQWDVRAPPEPAGVPLPPPKPVEFTASPPNPAAPPPRRQ